MKTRFFSTVFSRRFSVARFLLLSLFALLPLHVAASGFFIPSDYWYRTWPSAQDQITIKNHDVKVSIDRQVATTKVTQVFHNGSDYELEGTYVFPIPEDVALGNFTMHVNEKPLSAQILDKDKARKVYQGIVRSRQDPALLEYVGRGMVQASVYPIAPHSEMRISFEYEQILTADNGSIQYKHSLGTGSNVYGSLANVSISADISSEKNIVNLYSPTHELSIEKDGQRKATVSCTEEHVGASRDFILYYTVPSDEIGFNVLTYKNGEGEEDGFFLAMMSPNIEEINKSGTQPVVAKNVVFVVDTSGSMWGKKIEQAKGALQFCLQNLNEEDQFNIISFDSSVSIYKDSLLDASSSNIQQALSFVKSLDAGGCTNIDGALDLALKQLSQNDRPNMVIFLTDGLPNVGESNIDKIIENAKQRNTANARIFSFGVGHDVNTKLLDKLSLDNKGASDYVRPSENIETVVANFYKKVANPVLTDLLLQVSGTDIKELFPVTMPDLFHGSQLLVLGRYTNGGNVTLKLSGKQNKTEKQYLFTTEFTSDDTSNHFLPRLWASRKIAHLTDKVMLDGKNKDIVDEIVSLSKKYGIITKYTSGLIDVDAHKFGRVDEIAQCVYSQMSYDTLNQVGECACEQAMVQKSMRKGATVCSNYTSGDRGAEIQEKVRMVGARTFFLKEGVWIDSDHAESSSITKIKAFSDEYFEFLEDNPHLSIYFAIGKSVIIKTDTGSVQICDDESCA